MPSIDYPVIDRETITVAAVAIGFTASKIYGRTDGKAVQYAYCQCLTAPIRCTEDGTAPVAATASQPASRPRSPRSVSSA